MSGGDSYFFVIINNLIASQGSQRVRRTSDPPGVLMHMLRARIINMLLRRSMARYMVGQLLLVLTLLHGWRRVNYPAARSPYYAA